MVPEADDHWPPPQPRGSAPRDTRRFVPSLRSTAHGSRSARPASLNLCGEQSPQPFWRFMLDLWPIETSVWRQDWNGSGRSEAWVTLIA
jgi:hypothetical protein